MPLPQGGQLPLWADASWELTAVVLCLPGGRHALLVPTLPAATPRGRNATGDVCSACAARSLSVWAVSVLYCLGLQPEQASIRTRLRAGCGGAGAQSRPLQAALGRDEPGASSRPSALLDSNPGPVARVGSRPPARDRASGAFPGEGEALRSPGGSGCGGSERLLHPSLSFMLESQRSVPAESRPRPQPSSPGRAAGGPSPPGPGEGLGTRAPATLPPSPPPPAVGPAAHRRAKAT